MQVRPLVAKILGLSPPDSPPSSQQQLEEFHLPAHIQDFNSRVREKDQVANASDFTGKRQKDLSKMVDIRKKARLVQHHQDRSEERRAGTERVSTCRSRWSQHH